MVTSFTSPAFTLSSKAHVAPVGDHLQLAAIAHQQGARVLRVDQELTRRREVPTRFQLEPVYPRIVQYLPCRCIAIQHDALVLRRLHHRRLAATYYQLAAHRFTLRRCCRVQRKSSQDQPTQTNPHTSL